MVVHCLMGGYSNKLLKLNFKLHSTTQNNHLYVRNNFLYINMKHAIKCSLVLFCTGSSQICSNGVLK